MPFRVQSLVDLFSKLRGKEKRYKYEDELELAKLNFIRNFSERPKQLVMQSADFRWIEKLGTGGYSKVFLARHLGMKQYWAIKVIKKSDITNYKHLEHMKNEIKIHQPIEFPFIVGFRGHFEGNFNHYFILDYCGGGSLEKQFQVSARFPEEHVKFYASNVFLALEFLHSIDIVYRDLKPENLLIGEDGYIKLSDLGFAKMIKLRTTTFCGTNEYYAPEMFNESCKGSGKGYGKEVDWWTFGVLLYELATGQVPFPARDQGTYKTAVTSELHFELPDYLSDNFKDLLGHLITPPKFRYGGPNKSYKLIQEHPWFQDLNWDDVYEKRVKAPTITWRSPESLDKYTMRNKARTNGT